MSQSDTHPEPIAYLANYEVCAGQDLDSLEASVNQMLEHGYKPSGSIVVDITRDYAGGKETKMYLQPIFRPMMTPK